MPILVLDRDDLEDQFRLFKFVFEKNMLAIKVPVTETATRAAYFIGELPVEAQKIVLEFDFDANEKSDEKIDDIIHVVLDAKRRKSTKIIARHRFFMARMKSGEKFADFYKTLKSLADRCGFGVLKDELIRDMIIIGHNSQKFKHDLLAIDDKTTLERVAHMCEDYEDTVNATAELKASTSHHEQAHAVTDRKHTRKPPKKEKTGGEKEKPKPCKFCARTHVWGYDNCPAAGKHCGNCSGKNHSASACKKDKTEQWERNPMDFAKNDKAYEIEHGDAVEACCS